jgi:hypothetical protein
VAHRVLCTVIDSAMPRNRPVPCIQCGEAFNQGWATINHRRVCMPVENEVYGDGDVHEDVHEDEVYDDDDADVPYPYLDLHDYLEHLEEQGTLDTQHMLQYIAWKRRPLTDEVLEICRFLRSVECGGGSSDGGALHSLRYAKSLGGRGDLLPKTIDTCWKKISQVPMNVHFNVHYNVHFECTL